MTMVYHQRPTSAVHLAGSFIFSHVASTLTDWGQHCDNVLTLVSIIPDVILLYGIMDTGAGCTSVMRVVDSQLISYDLKSSDDVLTPPQVHDVITCSLTLKRHHTLFYIIFS